MSEVKEILVSNARKVLQKFDSDMQQYIDNKNKNRLGKVLTIVDGAIADETQRKAVKDLIHDSWYAYLPFDDVPRLNMATEALGFELWEVSTALPTPTNVRINPYKELVKE